MSGSANRCICRTHHNMPCNAPIAVAAAAAAVAAAAAASSPVRMQFNIGVTYFRASPGVMRCAYNWLYDMWVEVRDRPRVWDQDVFRKVRRVTLLVLHCGATFATPHCRPLACTPCPTRRSHLLPHPCPACRSAVTATSSHRGTLPNLSNCGFATCPAQPV